MCEQRPRRGGDALQQGQHSPAFRSPCALFCAQPCTLLSRFACTLLANDWQPSTMGIVLPANGGGRLSSSTCCRNQLSDHQLLGIMEAKLP